MPPKKSLSEAHLSEDVLKQQLKDNLLLSGALRVNPKNYEEAFIRHPIGDIDVYLVGLAARNKALNSDFVAVRLNPRSQWRVFDKFLPNAESAEAVAGSNNNARKRATDYTSVAMLMKLDPLLLNQFLGRDLELKFLEKMDVANTDPTDFPPDSWTNYIQRTGQVVGILRKMHSRICIGLLKPQQPNSSDARWSHALLAPIDSRIPRVRIVRSACPPAFVAQPDAYKFHRYICQITDWPDNKPYANGHLVDFIAPEGSNLIESETTRILTGCGYACGAEKAIAFNQPVNDYVQNFIERELAQSLEQQQQELAFREDLQSLCVFSIDPETARDLDDALHIRELDMKEIHDLTARGIPNARYEVGVHIADVSYYVRPDTPLDLEAGRRATSVYLVQCCVPMLPRRLCEDLCSLNPGEAKFTFSVIFLVNEDADVVSHRFSRTVINSCAKLSYEDAQAFLDAPADEWALHKTIHGRHSLAEIGNAVYLLNSLAVKMRAKRNLGGSLQLNQIKACFTLSDESSRMPVGMCPYFVKASNRLIEEWMLAANQAVAVHLAKELSEHAILRKHPPPNQKNIQETNLVLQTIGFDCQLHSAASIQKFVCEMASCPVEMGWQLNENLVELCAMAMDNLKLTDTTVAINGALNDTALNEHPRLSIVNESKILVLLNMLTKTMNVAEYMCLGAYEGDDEPYTRHYALNMQYYTHFTSPIRRYADLMVHRQLAATLARNETASERAAWWLRTAYNEAEITARQLQMQVEVCNARKLEARQASEESGNLYFIMFVKNLGQLTEMCSVVGVLDQCFEVIILSNGMRARVYLRDLDLVSWDHRPCQVHDEKKSITASMGKLILKWRGPDRDLACGCFVTEIRLFSIFRCLVTIRTGATRDDPLELPKLQLTLIRPTCTHCSD